MSLYLKYRPKTIDELDLMAVREQLTAIVNSGQIGHAYLLTGPRGAGKTSAARILARVVNCQKNGKKLGEPCNECDACRSILEGHAVDVIEIDAASNRGIDDVRELKDKIRLAPAILPKKVYIIDEVHMMTTDAFNALLKTLEEPPPHAIFILATTESHKVPATIISRCVRINFAKATAQEMQRSLQRVVKGEKVKIDKNALVLLSKSVDGSFRDGVKILEQVLLSTKEVEVADVERILSGTSGWSAGGLAESLKERNVDEALRIVQQAQAQGVDLVYLLVELMKELREQVSAGERDVIELIYQLDEVARKLSTSPVPAILLEITVIKWCLPAGSGNNQAPSANNQTNSKQQNDKQHTMKVKEKGAAVADSADLWKKMMSQLNGDSMSMGALLARAKPGVLKGNELTIEVEYEFHREQIMQNKFRSKLEELFSAVAGMPTRLTCEVGPVKLTGERRGAELKIEDKDDIFREAKEIFI